MSDLFGNNNFDEPKTPKSGVDNELNEFIMMEKQKAQLTAQVIFNFYYVFLNDPFKFNYLNFS